MRLGPVVHLELPDQMQQRMVLGRGLGWGEALAFCQCGCLTQMWLWRLEVRLCLWLCLWLRPSRRLGLIREPGLIQTRGLGLGLGLGLWLWLCLWLRAEHGQLLGNALNTGPARSSRVQDAIAINFQPATQLADCDK